MSAVCSYNLVYRQGGVLKLLHGEIGIDVPAAFYSGYMLGVRTYRNYTEGLVVSLGMVVRLNWLGGLM